MPKKLPSFSLILLEKEVLKVKFDAERPNPVVLLSVGAQVRRIVVDQSTEFAEKCSEFDGKRIVFRTTHELSSFFGVRRASV
jgi:hypothetical protein